MKCIDPGQRRRTNFHEDGAGLRSVRLALADAAVRGLVARYLSTQNYTRHWIGPERGTAIQVQYLRVYVGQLHRKVEEYADDPRIILTEPGIGYRITECLLRRPCSDWNVGL